VQRSNVSFSQRWQRCVGAEERSDVDSPEAALVQWWWPLFAGTELRFSASFRCLSSVNADLFCGVVERQVE
jgi:hypothetical protein